MNPSPGLLFRYACFFLLITLSYHEAKPQSYRQFVDSAFYFAGKKDFKTGIRYLERASLINSDQRITCCYNIACLASAGGDNDLAFGKIVEVLASDEWKNFNFEGDADLANLRADQRWNKVREQLTSLQAAKEKSDQLEINKWKQLQSEMNRYGDQELIGNTDKLSPTALYMYLRNLTSNYQYKQEGQYLNFFLKINDSAQTCYFIQLPDNFDYYKRYPLLVVLHGGVRITKIPKLADKELAFDYFGKSFLDRVKGMGMISVYPFADKAYNWMYPDEGFMMVPAIVTEMKKCFNVDDSRVYINGHSNGATGAFSYLMKEPDLFAGLSGFNNKPQVRTGGTFIMNAVNRNFYNVSTTVDYYFPFEGHLTLEKIMSASCLPWQNVKYHGPHWFPYLPQGELATQKLFDDMVTRKRDPFDNHIYWECDDVKYGKCDWMQINQLDTAQTRADWHQTINFKVNKWIDPNDTLKIIDSAAMAFTFPRKSGAVEADYKNNSFHVRTSCVQQFSIFISPEMVNMNKPIRIYVNGKLKFNARPAIDRNFMLANFRKNYDRQAVWAQRITVDVF